MTAKVQLGLPYRGGFNAFLRNRRPTFPRVFSLLSTAFPQLTIKPPSNREQTNSSDILRVCNRLTGVDSRQQKN